MIFTDLFLNAKTMASLAVVIKTLWRVFGTTSQSINQEMLKENLLFNAFLRQIDLRVDTDDATFKIQIACQSEICLFCNEMEYLTPETITIDFKDHSK